MDHIDGSLTQVRYKLNPVEIRRMKVVTIRGYESDTDAFQHPIEAFQHSWSDE